MVQEPRRTTRKARVKERAKTFMAAFLVLMNIPRKGGSASFYYCSQVFLGLGVEFGGGCMCGRHTVPDMTPRTLAPPPN